MLKYLICNNKKLQITKYIHIYIYYFLIYIIINVYFNIKNDKNIQWLQFQFKNKNK